MPTRCFLPTVRGLLAAAVFGGAATAGAEPVSLSVTSFAMSLGNGYGAEASEPGGTKLDAVFSTAGFAIQNFVLTNPNDSFTFNVGTVSFNEASVGGQETDDLDLGAFFTFANFGGGVQTIAGTGAAQPGTVNNDSPVDFSVSWAPLTFSFGNGSELRITMDDLVFFGTGSMVQTATITLLRTQDAQDAITVPEPGSLALAGLALVLLSGGASCRGRGSRPRVGAARPKPRHQSV
jgi:hypothetical protein